MTHLRADLTRREVLRPEDLSWSPTSVSGVERQRLERGGDEVERVTSIVRYAPGATFDEYEHTMGEEFLVLQGTFRDEHGEYPEGTYGRNPPGSAHTPSAPEGCTLFVKLRQFDPEDLTRKRCDTRARHFLPGMVPGLTVLPLHAFGTENVALVRWAPGTRFTPHVHHGGEEILVLQGTFCDEHGEYPTGTWIRSPPGSHHAPWSEEGCLIYVKTGHLCGA